MTEPVSKTTVGLQGGFTQCPETLIPYTGVVAGREVQYNNGARIGAELGIGTALGGKLEAGKEFNLSKTVGLDVSAFASNTTALVNGKQSVAFKHFDPIGDKAHVVAEKNEELRNSITKTGAKIMLNITPWSKWMDDTTFGVGISGQYVKNNGKNLELLTETSGQAGEEIYHTQQYSKCEGKFNEFVITPEISVEMKPTEHLSIGLDAQLGKNLNGANVKATWTF